MPQVKTSKLKIIKKSLPVFMKQGYFNTSISDLAKACDIEKPHFYYYFTSKADLMRTILKHFSNWVASNILCYANNDRLHPEEKLEKTVVALEKVCRREYVGCLFGNLVLETANTVPELNSTLKEYFELWKKYLTKIYTLKYTNDIAEKKAVDFLARLQGHLMLMKLYKDPGIVARFMRGSFEELR